MTIIKKLICFLVGHSWVSKKMTPENTSISELINELQKDTFVYCARCECTVYGEKIFKGIK